MWTTVLEEA